MENQDNNNQEDAQSIIEKKDYNVEQHEEKMEKTTKTKTIELPIEGMTCKSCEKTIKRAVEKLQGVKAANADHVVEKAVITYDPDKTSEKKIVSAIEKAGYIVAVKGGKNSRHAKEKDGEPGEYFEISNKAIYISVALGIGILLFGAYILLKNLGIDIQIPELSQNASYALLFGIGILTGFHCIAMCGGFVLSYTAKDANEAGTVNAVKKNNSSITSHLKYGISKTISYTIIGAIFGLIGSAIAFTPKLRGIVMILAAVFMIIFGLNMLGIFKSLRKIRIPQPRFISKIKAGKSPVAIGLLNGLFIACGPLQAMYILAAGTGSVTQGALSLFFFGLGTLPVMLGFGMAASYVSKGFTHKLIKYSGFLIIVLGLIMMNRGLALSGSGLDTNTIAQKITLSNGNLEKSGYKPAIDANTQIAEQKDSYQIIRMDVTNAGWTPDKFVLKKGVPVKWIIDGKQINSCNNAIVVPKYDLEFRIAQGEQTIEFTPKESGVIPWSCWMGMIPGTFIVKDELPTDTAQLQVIRQEAAAIPQQKSGSCGGSGSGGCGCRQIIPE